VRTTLVAALAAPLLAGCAGPRLGAPRPPLSVAACVKWSRPLPAAEAAGAGVFSSLKRVEGEPPYEGCDAVSETERFGVGWLRTPYMKAVVLDRCGRRVGRYSFTYKGEQWQEKLVLGLYDHLKENPAAAKPGAACDGDAR